MNTLRRVVTTTATVTVATLGLGAAFTAGIWWSDDTTTPPRSTPPPVDRIVGDRTGSPFRLVSAELRAATDCQELLDHYIDATIDQVGPYGWGGWYGPGVLMDGDVRSLDGVLSSAGEAEAGVGAPVAGAPAAGAPVLEGQASSTTGTNVQEAGVDEPDIVKTNGTLLVRVEDGELTTYDVTGDAPVRLGSLDLPAEVDNAELLLVGDRVVVLGTETGFDQRGLWGPEQVREVTRQIDVDVSDAASPAVIGERSWNARLLSARLHGTAVRLVLTSGLPQLDFVQPTMLRGEQTATERNREILRASTIEDWLPQVTDGAAGEDGATPVADCQDIAIPSDAPATGGLYVVGFDAGPDSTEREEAVTGLATATGTAYTSDDRLYVATGGFSGVPVDICCIDPIPMPGPMPVPMPGPMLGAPEFAGDGEDWGRTAIHAFALDGVATTYVASGEVDGIVADRWSMDEYDGVLRVAVGPSGATGNFNSVLTLEEQGDELVQIGSVDKLGVNEQIQSMRWYDGLAVMVTFRQIDPLYAIDLTDPRNPRALGELKIPGFSSYLHPLGSRRLIGMGQAADGSAQAAVFDLRDLADPVRQDWLSYAPNTWAAAGDDPRQFTWLASRRTALTVITQGWEGQTGWVSVLTLRDGELGNRMIEADFGFDVTRIRTVPLPSGEVALVTGDGVSFLPL